MLEQQQQQQQQEENDAASFASMPTGQSSGDVELKEGRGAGNSSSQQSLNLFQQLSAGFFTTVSSAPKKTRSMGSFASAIWGTKRTSTTPVGE